MVLQKAFRYNAHSDITLVVTWLPNTALYRGSSVEREQRKIERECERERKSEREREREKQRERQKERQRERKRQLNNMK